MSLLSTEEVLCVGVYYPVAYQIEDQPEVGYLWNTSYVLAFYSNIVNLFDSFSLSKSCHFHCLVSSSEATRQREVRTLQPLELVRSRCAFVLASLFTPVVIVLIGYYVGMESSDACN